MWLLNPGSEPFCFTEQYPPKVRIHTSTHILTHTSKKWILNRIQLKSKIVAYHLFVSIHHMNPRMYLNFQGMCKQLFWAHNVFENHKPVYEYIIIYIICLWDRNASLTEGEGSKWVTVFFDEQQFYSDAWTCPSDVLTHLHATAPNLEQ